MRLDINSKYAVVSDDLQFVVVEKSISNGEKTKGQPVERTLGYFRTLEGCFKFLIDNSIRISKSTDIKGLIKDVNKMKAEIDKVLEVLH